MNSGKSDIKSKRAKLLQKKADKQRAITKPIQISSSEDEHPLPLPVQKRRSSTPTPHQSSQKFNVFNIDKLKKIEIDAKPALSNELVIEETTNDFPMQHTEARALFSYRLEGNESTKYVSDLYLDQRIKKIAEEEIVRANAEKEQKTGEKMEVIDAVDKENKEEGKEEVEEEKKERNRPIRYFQSLVEAQNEENRLVKCFRCGNKGHIAKNCLEERQQQKCLFCLGDHHHHDCNSRTCFKCNEQGHIAQECRSVGIQCRKCSKKGHVQKQCGTIVFLDYSRIRSDQEFRDKYAGNDLKKLRCMVGCKDPNGHFNCHKYHQEGSKHIPYATYRKQHAQLSFKALAKYDQADFDRRYERKPQWNFQRSYERGNERSYEQRGYEHKGYDHKGYDRRGYDHKGYDRTQDKNSSHSKQNQSLQAQNYDRYNQKYNIRYDFNINQRINDRYDYRGPRW